MIVQVSHPPVVGSPSFEDARFDFHTGQILVVRFAIENGTGVASVPNPYLPLGRCMSIVGVRVSKIR